jgi:hypothetical protein
MTYAASVVSTCGRFGPLGHWLRDTALPMAFVLWTGLITTAVSTKQVYMLAMLLVYVLCGAIGVVLQLQFDEPQPHAQCNWRTPANVVGTGLPATPVFDAFAYVAVAITHNIAARTWREQSSTAIRACAVVAFVPTLLTLNGVYSLRQSLLSALLGLTVGFAFMLPLRHRWFIYCDIATRMPFMQRFSWTHRPHDLYDCSSWLL